MFRPKSIWWQRHLIKSEHASSLWRCIVMQMQMVRDGCLFTVYRLQRDFISLLEVFKTLSKHRASVFFFISRAQRSCYACAASELLGFQLSSNMRICLSNLQEEAFWVTLTWIQHPCFKGVVGGTYEGDVSMTEAKKQLLDRERTAQSRGKNRR